MDVLPTAAPPVPPTTPSHVAEALDAKHATTPLIATCPAATPLMTPSVANPLPTAPPTTPVAAKTPIAPPSTTKSQVEKSLPVAKLSTEDLLKATTSPPVNFSPVHINTYNSIIKNLQKTDLDQAVDSLHSELLSIITGNESSWYHKLYTTGKVKNSPWLKKQDLPFGFYFGALNDDQLDWIIDKLFHIFPGINHDQVFKVIFPETIICMCRDKLNISYDEAVEYLQTPNSEEVDKILSSLSMKKNARKSKRKCEAINS